MKKSIAVLSLCLCSFVLLGAESDCEQRPTSDTIQRQQQEVLLQEATSSVGMPAIKNFRERKILKDILELRDQEGLVTYTYLQSEQTGKLIYLGETIGYGIPYATQFTNPQKIAGSYSQGGFAILPQADPNGLFSPASAEGTWVLLKDPNGDDVRPIYCEPRIVVSPFRLESTGQVEAGPAVN
ncbi:MAG: hypothetical protein A2571_01850 [Candidatus Vogelbacteria bacterium RIFOXYD1_FULL_44_32]|uniref:Uncharacterized protein n=1 Tax=Candidatus Vogelbacteria bacterium RIFOXYD1_FULL_44_32 TaxID=1802438 RepID=A0A1G2QEJ5_9BACT|nr:MAG: hypothetical protein A2571_01850 [Candidatus Vogelbacteria bacterium RIFOXYD1_FULL_44_32]